MSTLTDSDEKMVQQIAEKWRPEAGCTCRSLGGRCSGCKFNLVMREELFLLIREAISYARQEERKFTFDVLKAYESERMESPSDLDAIGEIRLALRGDTIGGKSFLRRHNIEPPVGEQGKEELVNELTEKYGISVPPETDDRATETRVCERFEKLESEHKRAQEDDDFDGIFTLSGFIAYRLMETERLAIAALRDCIERTLEQAKKERLVVRFEPMPNTFTLRDYEDEIIAAELDPSAPDAGKDK